MVYNEHFIQLFYRQQILEVIVLLLEIAVFASYKPIYLFIHTFKQSLR